MKKTFLAACAATLLFGATIAPAMAQDANDASGANASATDTTRGADANRYADNDHDGFPWGLLGLLGLAGLMKGKQRTVVHNDTVRTSTNTTGTPR